LMNDPDFSGSITFPEILKMHDMLRLASKASGDFNEQSKL